MSQLSADEVETIIFDIYKCKKKFKGKFVVFEEQMKEKYHEFIENYPELFKLAINSNSVSDLKMVKYMLSMLRKMESGNITEKNASIAVGQVLVDKYVKPLVEDK